MVVSINWDEAEDVTAKVLPKLIEEAKAGDRAASLRLLDIFCAMVDSGRPPYPELLSYLSGRLAGVLDGKDANQALGIKKPRHRPRGAKGLDTRERDELLALEVSELIDQGHTWETAIDQVAEQYKETYDIVKHAYRTYRYLFTQP
jgi:hypothetical protein